MKGFHRITLNTIVECIWTDVSYYEQFYLFGITTVDHLWFLNMYIFTTTLLSLFDSGTRKLETPSEIFTSVMFSYFFWRLYCTVQLAGSVSKYQAYKFRASSVYIDIDWIYELVLKLKTCYCFSVSKIHMQTSKD